MFTGIIQSTGKILSFKGPNRGGRLTLTLTQPFKKIQMGESIAVNGCCLTVVGHRSKQLIFDVSDETLRKTTLGSLKPGTVVNLERALRASDRLGGHFVLGHVDGMGRILSLRRSPGSLRMEISIPTHLSRFLIDKGSVAVDGVSLTASVGKPGELKVYLIPHTEKTTNLRHKKAGDAVNVEMDVLGKYVERLISRK